MATFGRSVRRGLPRRPGGEPWPAAAEAPVAIAPTDPAAEGVAEAAVTESSTAAAPAAPPAPAAAAVPGASVASRPAEPREVPRPAVAQRVRRGLPRVPGGEPWPAASVLSTTPAPAAHPSPAAPLAASPIAEVASGPEAPRSEATPAAAGAAPAAVGSHKLRRGLPRTAGGEPWPPDGFAPATPAAGPTTEGRPAPADAAGAADAVTGASPAPVVSAPGPRAPLPFRQTAFPGVAARTRPEPKPEPPRYGPFTRAQWAGAALVGGLALLFAAALLVLLVRWVLSLPALHDFLSAYPGEYHLPAEAPVGLPAWLGWQHFLNTFFMLLIIRTGLQVRHQKRPSMFWSPRGNKMRKISIALWLHQSLDILWVANGVIFVVLLFATGQWMRIVPTSWEVFPNALSAALQYVSLDWPTENGWVNYNALQQLAYFTTVFIAAPLAIVTGVRMSGIWPKNATALNRAYPVEWARKVHFPVMLYFVVFIAIHVFLVFATGALRNLNHMYAAQGSVDPNAYADNWTGFWLFVASLVVIAVAWVAARPLVLAPIARLFGNVSGR